MYMLLCGNPPFTGCTNEKIMNSIESGIISYSGPIWKNVSNEAISLLKKMLTYNNKLRISAADALNDSWFVKYEEINDDKDTLDCISALRTFQVNFVMKKAVLDRKSVV